MLENITFPEPVISQAIEPKTKADQEKLGQSLVKLCRRRSDLPDVHGRRDRADNHLRHGRAASGDHRRPAAARVQSAANVGKPQVAYKEAITKTVEKQGRYVRQTGGKGQYGDAWIRVEPLPPGFGRGVRERRSSAAYIPREFIKPIEQACARRRWRACSPATRCSTSKRVVFDGSYHDVDSNEMAFKIAGSMAFKEANRAAGPIIKEPIMAVEVVTPDSFLGDVIGDLTSRRGHVLRMEPEPRRRAEDQRDRAAFRDVWLRDGSAQPHARPRDATRWSSRTTRKSRRTSPKRSSRRTPGKVQGE